MNSKLDLDPNPDLFVIIPQNARKRKVYVPSTRSRPISTEAAVIGLFNGFVSLGDSPEAAVLKLMQRYTIAISVFQIFCSKKLKLGFCGAKYSSIAHLFNLNPDDIRIPDRNRAVPVRSRVPVAFAKKICRDIELTDIQCGPLKSDTNEETSSRYVSTVCVHPVNGLLSHADLNKLFHRIAARFQRTLNTHLMTIVDEDAADTGRMEQKFVAFGAIFMLFVDTKRGLSGRDKADSIVRALATADACDYFNNAEGLCVPIFVILSDGQFLQFLTFDPSTRDFKLSQEVLGLQQECYSYELEFLCGVKRNAEYMFDFFLSGYNNALLARVNRLDADTTVVTDHEDKAQWALALRFAQQALDHARAGAVAKDIDSAEVLAKKAFVLLKSSVREAIEVTGGMLTPLMGWWNEEALLEA